MENDCRIAIQSIRYEKCLSTDRRQEGKEIQIRGFQPSRFLPLLVEYEKVCEAYFSPYIIYPYSYRNKRFCPI
jgi:hypothetical protein